MVELLLVRYKNIEVTKQKSKNQNVLWTDNIWNGDFKCKIQEYQQMKGCNILKTNRLRLTCNSPQNEGTRIHQIIMCFVSSYVFLLCGWVYKCFISNCTWFYHVLLSLLLFLLLYNVVVYNLKGTPNRYYKQLKWYGRF